MKYYKRILVLLLVCINIINTSSQDCKDYHKRSLCYRQGFEEGFNYYGQSASALAQKDITLKYNAVFYGEKDYVVTVCTPIEYLPVHYAIYDADTKELIYDNEEDNYVERVMFSMEYTRSLVFEITVLADKIKTDRVYDLRTCVGVLILWRKTPKIGF